MQSQKPPFISPTHRQHLQAELQSDVRPAGSSSSYAASPDSSVAPSLLPSRRPSISSLAEYGSTGELDTPTEASQRRWGYSSSSHADQVHTGPHTHLAQFPATPSTSHSQLDPSFCENTNKTSRQRVPSSSLSTEASWSSGGSNVASGQRQQPSLVVISGGSAGNALVESFVHLASSIVFVLPVSDNGGSSSELIRVFGGPSIGDLRSRLIRLIPGKDQATEAIKQLLSYRLSATEPARPDWHAIVEGQHELWAGMPPDRKEILRSFLVHFEAQILARAHRRFNFAGGSIGNFFLWACLSFFRNIESAIYLFSTLTRIPEHHMVCPCINTNSIVTIAAELENGSHVVGQNAISHPEPTTMTSAVHGQPAAAAAVAAAGPSLEGTTGLFLGEDDQLGHQDSAPVDGKNPNLIVSKEVDVPLPSRIRQLYYINNYGLRVQPRPNPRYIQALTERDMLVYACGSLYTSIMPCLALPGVAQAIAAAPSRGSARLKSKVLLLNSLPDRETPRGYTAVDYIQAIQKCLNSNLDPTTTPGAPFAPSRYITHCVYVEGSEITVDPAAIKALGIEPVEVASVSQSRPYLGESQVYEALYQIAHQ